MTSIKNVFERSRSASAKIEICKTLALLGDIVEIQDATRTSGCIASLLEEMLSSNEQLQSHATRAIQKLLLGNADNVDEVLKQYGLQKFVLLLKNENTSVQGDIAACICGALDSSTMGESRAARVGQAIIDFGGVNELLSLLGASDRKMKMSGLMILHYLSMNHAVVIRAAGAIPFVVPLLGYGKHARH